MLLLKLQRTVFVWLRQEQPLVVRAGTSLLLSLLPVLANNTHHTRAMRRKAEGADVLLEGRGIQFVPDQAAVQAGMRVLVGKFIAIQLRPRKAHGKLEGC